VQYPRGTATHTQPFEFTVCDRTIRVYGDVDMAATEQLVQAIRCVAQRMEHHAIVLDLASLTFMDAMGINALIQSHQELEGMGKELVIDSLPERIHRLFDLAGVADSLNLRSTLV
jgi:anti-anti-sigma factor